MQRLFDETLDRFGGVDTLINNVGNMRGHKPSQIVDMDWEFWEVSVAQNLKSTFLCSQAAARAMIANQTKGAIVNIASLSGLRASVRLAPYGAAKAGVMQFTKTLAVELAPHGIRVNCVGPASINAPPGKTRLPQWRMDEMAKSIPLGRLSEPEDIAGDRRGPRLRPRLIRHRPDRDVRWRPRLHLVPASDAGQPCDEAEGLRREVRLGRAGLLKDNLEPTQLLEQLPADHGAA